jgi:hypothetical protein
MAGMLATIALGLALMGQAGPPDEVFRCGHDVTTEAERAAIADALIANTSPPIVDEVGARLRDCAIRAGHEEATGRPLVAAGLGLLAAEGLRPRLAAVGIDMMLVDRWLGAQDTAFRTTLPDDSAGERLILGLNEQGIPLEALTANAELIGNYFGVTIMVERARLGLPLE